MMFFCLTNKNIYIVDLLEKCTNVFLFQVGINASIRYIKNFGVTKIMKKKMEYVIRNSLLLNVSLMFIILE